MLLSWTWLSQGGASTPPAAILVVPMQQLPFRLVGLMLVVLSILCCGNSAAALDSRVPFSCCCSKHSQVHGLVRADSMMPTI